MKTSILVNLGVPIELEIGSEAVELEDEVNSFFFFNYQQILLLLLKKKNKPLTVLRQCASG